MPNDLLLLVDDIVMDAPMGAINGLKNSYVKWGFRLEDKYNTMVFRGDLSVLGGFTEFHKDYFDKNQALGKEFLFIIKDCLDEELRSELNNFPIFDYGYWQLCEIPAYILLIHKATQVFNLDSIMEQLGAKKIFKLSYLLPHNSLELIIEKIKEIEMLSKGFTIFECYVIGDRVSITTWKRSFYEAY